MMMEMPVIMIIMMGGDGDGLSPRLCVVLMLMLVTL